MQPVVGDGNEGIGCPAQELYPLTLQHCEGHLPQGKETFSLEVKSPFHPPPTPDLWDPLWRSWVREDRRILSTETVPGNSCRSFCLLAIIPICQVHALLEAFALILH